MIELQTLGAADIRGIPLPAARALLSQPRRFALLAYLALARPFGFHRRDTLLALFWAESDEARARLALRQALHHIRRAVGEGVVVSRGSDELGIDEARIQSDGRDFERAINAGELERALDLYRGDLLPGFFLSEAAGLESWLAGERDRYRERACSAASKVSSTAEASGDFPKAIVFARRSLEISPQDEGLLRRQMGLLDRAGDRTGALRVYDAFGLRLAAEWEDSPAPESVALAETIRGRRTAPLAFVPLADHTPRNGADDQPLADSISAAAEEANIATSAELVGSEAIPGTGRGHPIAMKRRIQTAIIASVVLLGVSWIGARIVRGRLRDRAAVERGTERVVVLPFEVRSAPAWNYLGEGMVDLLGAKLDGAGRLRAADAGAVLALARRGNAIGDAARARDISRKLGGQWFVLGSIFADSSGVQLRATLYDVDGGKVVARAASDGQPRDLFRLVDELSRNLLQGVQNGPADDLNRLATQTTTSLPALKDYLQGEAAFRSGHFDQAVQDFQRSTDRDTTFALADYRFAVASDFAGEVGGAIDFHSLRAERHSARLGYNARMLLHAFRALREGRDGDAQQIYRGILATQPDNVEAWYQLADIQFHHGPREGHPSAESRAAFDNVLRYDPFNASALVHLARLAAIDERWLDLDSLTHRVLARYPNGDEASEMLAVRGVALRDDSALTAIIDTLRESTAIRRLVTARRGVASGANPARAASLFILLTNPASPSEFRARGYLGLADIEAAQGRWRLARVRLADAQKLSVDNTLLRATSFATSGLIPLSSADLEGWAALAKSRDTSINPPRSVVTAADDGKAGKAAVTGKPKPVSSFEVDLLYAVGVFEARTGLRDLAVGRLAQIERWARQSPESTGASRSAPALRAYISLHDDSLRSVLRNESARGASLNQLSGNGAGSVADQAFLRAEVLRQLGRNTEALVWYRLAAEDEYGGIIYRASSHWRSAEILDRLGRRGEALPHYEHVVESWRDADRELQPFVAKAISRIAEIRRL